jgi:hypothetical protein
MTRLHSKTLLFAFLASVTCSAVWAAPDHTIVVSAQSGSVHYNHTSGKGLKGFVFVQRNHQVQWSCTTDPGSTCGLVIDFGSALPPCKSPAPGSMPTATVTCDVNYDQINGGCQKSHAGPMCIQYNTKFYKDGTQMSLMDDPEFIVDGSGGTLPIGVGTAGLGGLAVLLLVGGGIFFGRRIERARTR